MSRNFCDDCERYLSSFSQHVCPPKWQAVRPDTGDPDNEASFYKAFGDDAESAALEIADRKFSDWDYPRDMEIWVRKTQDDQWEKYEITVQSVPSFSATRITEEVSGVMGGTVSAVEVKG